MLISLVQIVAIFSHKPGLNLGIVGNVRTKTLSSFLFGVECEQLQSTAVAFNAESRFHSGVPVSSDMDRRGSLDDSFNDQALPIPIQIFLWRQVR